MEQSFIAYIENSIKENWDLDALTDYKGATLQYKDVARKLLTKLIADESLHLKLLTRQLKVMAGDDKKYDELMKKILD